jgi:hypothetical protein
MKKLFVAVALLFSACTDAQIQQAEGVGAVVVPVAAQAAKAAPILSQIALAGCAAQAAANVAGTVAAQQGNAAWAANFSQASAVAGLACAW